MSNRRLTVWIDGQEALPVRALPYVTTSTRFRPDALARRFAGRDPFGRTWYLTAHHYLGKDDASYSVMPEEWEEIVTSLDDFSAELKKQFPKWKKGYAVWKDGAVAMLPPCWYVILDEFEKTFHSDNDWMFDKKRPDDHELILSPFIDANTRATVMEGFENCVENKVTTVPPHRPQVEPIEHITTVSHPLKKTKAKRIHVNEAFLLDCEREGVAMDIESVWIYIRRNLGKDHSLFKTIGNESATTMEGKRVDKKNLGRFLLKFLKKRTNPVATP